MPPRYADLVTPGHQLLEHLNEPQREAVLHERGPLLILAGAGSGKTRTVTHRMAYLISRGCPHDAILAITFTNKAAGEMQDRMERLAGIRSPWVSTFHSFCARILRREIHRLQPYDASYTIYDTDDVRSLLKEILEQQDVDRALWQPRAAQEEISRIKNVGCGEVEIGPGAQFARRRAIQQVYEAYVDSLRKRNALDFDDLLLLTVKLFEEHPDVLERYQRQFQHVLIDEYQDTNALQYRIGRHLTAKSRNICITGDPDQSIYAWRGADLSNILNFEVDYPDARVILLEENYRSTGKILEVANALIVHNTERREKTLWTNNEPGEPVRVYRFPSEEDEAREVATLVEEVLGSGVPAGDVAIFYRTNALSRPVEQAFVRFGIPYSIVGNVAFYQRKEVKDVLAYLKILANPRDLESLKRIINVPTRGLGKSTFSKLAHEADAHGVPVLEGISSGRLGKALGKRAAAALAAFAGVHAILKKSLIGPVPGVIRAVIEETGYAEHLRRTEGDEAREALENVYQLVNAATEFQRERPVGSLVEFLEVVNLLGDVDRWHRSEDRVTLMTLHSAKGLEFPVVIIVGVEDGLLPLTGSNAENVDLEEERRLLYVGITRARRTLFLTHTASRMRFGSVRAAYPSCFLREIRGAAAGREAASIELDSESNESLLFDRDDPDSAAGRETPRGRLPGFEFEGDVFTESDLVYEPDPEEDPFPVGARVAHERYGEGRVVRRSGLGRSQRLTIDFDEGGEKQIVLSFASLRRVR